MVRQRDFVAEELGKKRVLSMRIIFIGTKMKKLQGDLGEAIDLHREIMDKPLTEVETVFEGMLREYAERVGALSAAESLEYIDGIAARLRPPVAEQEAEERGR